MVKSKMEPEEKVAAWIVAVILLFNLAWIGLVVWALIEIVSWLVTQ